MIAIRTWAFRGLVVVFLCVAVYAAHTVMYDYPSRDEGVSLYGAIRVINGDAPYKNFFHLTTPGAVWVVALAFKVVGEKLVVARVLYLFFGALLSVTIYMSTQRLTRSPLVSLLPACLFFLLDICAFLNFTPHIPSISLAALGIFLLLDFTGPGSVALSGLAISLSFLMSQNIGLFAVLGGTAILATAGWLKENPVKIIAIFLAGFFLPLLGFLISMGLQGALREFVYDCFIWTMTRYSDFNTYPYLYKEILGAKEALRTCVNGRGGLMIFEVAGSMLVVGFLPFILFPFVICTSYMRRDWRTWAASVGGLSIFVSSSNRPDFLHLLHVMPFVLVLSFYTIHSLTVELIRSGKKVLYIPLTALALPIFLFTIEGGSFLRDMVSMSMVTLTTERGDVKMPMNEYAVKKKLFEYIGGHVPAGGEIYVIHWSPEVYFFTGRRNPTPFDMYKPIYFSRAQSEEILTRLSEAKPPIVVQDDFIAGFFDPMSKTSLTFPAVDRSALLAQDFIKPYVLRHYVPREKIGTYAVYMLRNL